MPRKLRVPKMRSAPVNPYLFAYLQTGEIPERGSEPGWFTAYVIIGVQHSQELRPVWDSVRAPLLEEWIADHPGTRPFGWWLFDAPRWQPPYPERCRVLACATLAEPRRRLGGTGTPSHECLNYFPHFDRGIPTSWVTEDQQEYYNGRAVNVHGQPIGTEFFEGHFAGLAPRADDPPLFESEAQYLDRHGLLSAAERRRLKPDAFEPEALRIENDAD